MVLDVLNFICRLQENIEPAPENQLSSDEICKAVDTCKSPAMGRIIQKVFPNVVVQIEGVKMTGQPELSYIREYLGEQGLIFQLTLNLKIYLTLKEENSTRTIC